MQSFLIRRLLPFYAFTLITEFAVFGFLAFWQRDSVDWGFLAMIKTSGVLLLTTTVSFFYMMIPYVLYLLALPQNKVNGRADRIITTVIYTIYIYSTFFEEAASLIFWEEFSSAFNFIAVDYLIYTHEAIRNIYQAFPVVWYLLGILAATLLVVLFSRRFLFTRLPAPNFAKKLFHTAIYLALCALTFINVDIANLKINQNRTNNELSKEGTYSLFSALWKNELPYGDFYLTQTRKENLQILERQLKTPEAEFIAPTTNIFRDIDYNQKSRKHNVIVILMESMAAKYMNENRRNDAVKITPNLSQLAEQGIYFAQAYATGPRSVNAIEAVMLGMPSLPGLPVVRRPGNENLYSAGTIFAAKGYENKWIYGGIGYFENMTPFFAHNGFKIIDRTHWERGEAQFATAWGASDEDLYAKIMREANASYEKGKPFFTIALTLSNRKPFAYPSGRIDTDAPISEREGAVKYSDYALGKFMEEAAREPWFENTVFVFVGDHVSGAAKNDELASQYYHIPIIFYAPKLLKPQRVNASISQIDITPTLLGILKFDYESRFYGRDVLQKGYRPRYFISNYQKLGYVKNGVKVVLQPIKEWNTVPKRSPFAEKYRREAVAYYQNASNWRQNLKQDKPHEDVE